MKTASVLDGPREISPGTPPAPSGRRVRRTALFAPDMVKPALKQAFVMLRPDIQWENPVMFVVEVGAVLTLLFVIQAAFGHSSSQVPITYFIALDVWLFLTVLFANFATGLAEARGRAQAESLRRTRRDTPAYRLRGRDSIEEVLSTDLRPGDRVVVTAGQIIPSDGEIIEGHRLGRRVRHHRRVRTGDPGGRRRPFGRNRRHRGSLGPDRGAHYRGARAVLP